MLREVADREGGDRGLNRSEAPRWFPDWTDQIVAVVASGPSATDEPLDPLRDLGIATIAVNTSFRLVPWADMLYACDYRWWEKFDGMPGWTGLKVSQDPACQLAGWGVRRVYANHASDRIEMKRVANIGWAGNSGFQAINIAAQSGARRIVLIGFDQGGPERWHAPHGPGHPTPRQADIDRHRRATDAAYGQLLDHGIEAILTSRRSALQNYPVMSLEEALR